MSTYHPHQNGHQDSDQAKPVLLPPADSAVAANPAADLIRQKLAAIYGDEPNAQQEMAEAELPGLRHSRHQQFMLSLHQSGRSASEIQTAWHQYYMELDDREKRSVWQEFYDQSAQAKQQASRILPKYVYQPDQPAPAQQPTGNANISHNQQRAIYPTATAFQAPPSPTNSSNSTDLGVPIDQFEPPQPLTEAWQPPVGQAYKQPQPLQPSRELNASLNPLLGGNSGVAQPPAAPSAPTVSNSPQDIPPAAIDDRQPDTIRRQLRSKVSDRSKLKVKHHLQSLLFGLGFGVLTLVIVLFGFFNEVVIAPFIQPSRNVSATPIIISPDGVAASDKNSVIIPKINVEIPLDFSATGIDEKAFESALDKGVAHYPTTALPGQQGNASFFGHSSNNIFNPGKYKFAFVLLNELVPGDTFYITYNGVSYGYTIYDKKIVSANAVEILQPVQGKASTAMLVTCDPPGTSLNRLVVWGEQISPNPSSNIAAAATPATTTKDTTALPGNGPTLWGRLVDWITGN